VAVLEWHGDIDLTRIEGAENIVLPKKAFDK
jgi:hypothetical protein